jgi:voltage-gated potassium channel
MNRAALIRQRLYELICAHDTARKALDVASIAAILLSVLAVMLDSVAEFSNRYDFWLKGVEWAFTVFFTVEYFFRLLYAPNALRYARSFFGIVDLLAILPAYMSVTFPQGRFLLTVRVLRVVRVFRVLKLAHFVGEAQVLVRALRASWYKISVFLLAVLTIAVLAGSLMYLIEGAASGFTNIPQGIYWAIVTLTTVGYGDIAPQTALGRGLAALLMMTGYGIIAVPTGIVSVELGRASTAVNSALTCSSCGRGGHDADAVFCKYCGGYTQGATMRA